MEDEKMLNNERIKLSTPWVIFYRQIQALFKKDPAVKVVYDQVDNVIRIYVEGGTKAEAIEKLLPSEKTFGNVTVRIVVIPSNLDENNKISLFEKAFDGNPILSTIISGELFGNSVNYVLFKKEVVQFYNDDLSDAHGVCSTLYQEIAKEVFGEDKGVFFCTEVDGSDLEEFEE
jgi:hypothetical protein